MPKMVVKMKPDGSFEPGVISLAITPATKPIMMVKIIPIVSSDQAEAGDLRESAAEISANVAFSASLTVTPPNPKNPPSFPASAAFCATAWSQDLNATASSGALESTISATDVNSASAVCFNTVNVVPAN